MSSAVLLSPSLLDRGIFSIASYLADGSELDRYVSDFLLRLLPISYTRCVKSLSKDDGEEIVRITDGRPEWSGTVIMPNDHLLSDLSSDLLGLAEYRLRRRSKNAD